MSKEWLLGDYDSASYDEESDEDFILREEDMAEDDSGTSSDNEYCDNDMPADTDPEDNVPATNQVNGQENNLAFVNGNADQVNNGEASSSNHETAQMTNGHHDPTTNGKSRSQKNNSNNSRSRSSRTQNNNRSPTQRYEPYQAHAGQSSSQNQDPPYHPKYYPPNYKFQKLNTPFKIFSQEFNQYHEDQEMELKSLAETERKMTEERSIKSSQTNNARKLAEEKRVQLMRIVDTNNRLKNKVELIHDTILPVFNNLLRKGGDSEENDDILDSFTIGPFFLDFVKRLKKTGRGKN